MAPKSLTRLKWKRTPRGSFVAYPNGENAINQVATVLYSHPDNVPVDTWSWFWTVAWPGRFYESGMAPTKQQAADRATDAWWAAIERTEEWYRVILRYREFMDRLSIKGEFDLADLDMANAQYEDLIRIMDECCRRWRGERPYGFSRHRQAIQDVIFALSEEFYRRRSGNKKPREV